MVVLLQRGWHEELAGLIASARRRLVISAPFMSKSGTRIVSDNLGERFRNKGRLELLTDLSPSHVSDGSLDIAALAELQGSVADSCLWHVPRLHAKVYIADEVQSIVTSGNLTAGGLFHNAEYGVLTAQTAEVRAIQSDFDDYRAAGTQVEIDDLLDYARAAAEVHDAAVRRRAGNPILTRAFENALRSAEDQLIRLRLRGGAIHTVFAKTVRFLLTKYGPMSTAQIHDRVRALHPDMCDDSVDRVIDGKHFGRKWKHAVRTAQQQLKRAGIVEYGEGKWRLMPECSPDT